MACEILLQLNAVHILLQACRDRQRVDTPYSKDQVRVSLTAVILYRSVPLPSSHIEFSYDHDAMLQSRQVVTILANLSVLEQCTADVLEEKGMCAKHQPSVFLPVLRHLRVTRAVFRNRAAAGAAEREALVLQPIGGRRVRARSTESCRHTGSSQQRPAGRSDRHTAPGYEEHSLAMLKTTRPTQLHNSKQVSNTAQARVDV